jgi:hypothetical protein
MIQVQNAQFVERVEQRECFVRLLQQETDPVIVLALNGHVGVGKSRLVEEFRWILADKGLPFAYLSPRHLDDDPSTLLIRFAQRLGLDSNWKDGAQTFEEHLARFSPALMALSDPVAVLIVDNYEQMLNLDPYVRHLIRDLAKREAPFGSATHSAPSQDAKRSLPRVVIVMVSRNPLGEYWPFNPLCLELVRNVTLQDFTFMETRTYLEMKGISPAYHQKIFHLTHGYPLALAMIAELDIVESLDDLGPRDALKLESDLLTSEDLSELVNKILNRALSSLDETPLRHQLIELLRAGAVVRRFSQPMLAALLDTPALQDNLFDRITNLAMVRKWTREGKPHLFAIHESLRDALTTDASERGLQEKIERYRQRALGYYKLLKEEISEGGEEWALDILFLHSSQSIRDLFFGGGASSSPTTAPAAFGELSEVVSSLMQGSTLFEEVGFSGGQLLRLIRETHEWMALDWKLHDEYLEYFRVVRRRNNQIAGFSLIVPVTKDTLPLLHNDTVSSVYEKALGAIEINSHCYFLLRFVVDELDAKSALLRAIFSRLIQERFVTVITAVFWPDVLQMMKVLGFEVLAHEVEYDGYTYDIMKLDVAQYGGPVAWLLQFVSSDMGLVSEDWESYLREVKAALTKLWHDPESLTKAARPLMHRLGIAELEPDVFVQAETVRKVLCAAGEAIKPPDDMMVGSHYELLNSLYGLGGKEKKAFMRSLDRPNQQTVFREKGIPNPRRHLRQAIGAIAQALLRKRR